MVYRLFYTGLASTPNSVGLLCSTTNDVVCEISTSRPSGKETRKVYEKMKNKLKEKFGSLL